MRLSSFPVRSLLLASVALLLGSCLEPYAPEVISAPKSYLVVEGFINADGVSTFHLSHTYPVAYSNTTPPREAGATLFVEQESGPRYALRETEAGTYASDKLKLAPGKSYRLTLTTAAGRRYASDFVPAQVTPAIDDVTWKIEDEGVSIAVDTHDAANATHYYQWQTEDTWEIRPKIFPLYEYVNDKVVPIAVRYPFVCYGHAVSPNINLFKTTGLAQDVVSKHVVFSLGPLDSKLYHKYSILVKQYAQTKEEYAFWEQLRKNTETLGTLFDPLPGQTVGNLHCLDDSAEPVLGYVGAHTVTEKRIFIERSVLPHLWRFEDGYEKCATVQFDAKDATLRFPLGDIVPVDATFDFSGNPLVYSAATPYCVDCRLRGSDVKPDYWQ